MYSEQTTFNQVEAKSRAPAIKTCSKKLQKKLEAYAEQINEEVDLNYHNIKDKINYLKNLSKTPLQKHMNEIINNASLSKEIIEFDKKFFQN